MRLAFISTMAGSPWGGSEELWAATARAALSEKHQVLIIAFDWGAVPPHIKNLERCGAQLLLRPRKSSRLGKILRTFLPIAPAWTRTLDRFSPHSVLVSQGSAYECAARSASRPLLNWLTQRTPPAPYINLVQFNRPGIPRKHSTVQAARRYYHHAAANLFVCRRNAQEAADWLGTPVPRARIVCNPVNLADTTPLPWPCAQTTTTESTIRIACVGRLETAVKGQDLLLAALAEVGDDRLELTLAGTGPDETALRATVARLGLERRVHFAGHIADVRTLWATHHLLAMASHAEGTPLAMVEAMLLARPVIVTDVGGCADWVTYGREGWIAATPSPQHIAAAIRAALAVVPKWPALGVAARQRALELFDPHAGRTVLEILVAAGTAVT